MAYSAATYKGDGSQSTFMIPFDYLQKDFVKVTVNEVDKVYAQDYSVDGRELSFPTAPPSGSTIKVYRETPTDRMVKWNEGSVLTSSNMTTQQIQELHLIEETTYNLKESAMTKTEDGHKWEGQYLPLTHVGNPTDDSDVVNLGTIKKEETGFLASVRIQLDKWLADLGTTYNNYSKSLKDAFDSYTSTLLTNLNTYKASLKSDFDSYTSTLLTTYNEYKSTLLNKYNEYLGSLTATKDAVKDSEANASKYKDEANQAKESASASANTATTKATESGNSASLAKKWAVSATSPDGAVGSKSAKTWAEEAKSSEENATTSANNAKSSEENATTSANNAKSSEDKAKTSEVNAKASETASANSASASAKSATAAKGSEDKAKTSEANAKASEVAAAESAKQAAAGQINADWNETNADSKAYIKNKPDIANSITTKALTVIGETSVPTANAGNSSKAIANTEFVAKSLAALVDSAPDQLNTLNELAKALGNDSNFAATVTKAIGEKAAKAGDTLTGPLLYSKTPSDDTELVNKAYVDALVAKAMADATAAIEKQAKLDAHPVGSYYFSDDSTSPSDLFGGTWEALPAGYTLIAQGSGTDDFGSFTYTAGQKYGERKHKLTTDELPSHSHTYERLPKMYDDTNYTQFDQANFDPSVRLASNTEIANTKNTGANSPHNNIQPSVCAYCWKRTA